MFTTQRINEEIKKGIIITFCPGPRFETKVKSIFERNGKRFFETDKGIFETKEADYRCICDLIRWKHK